MSEARFEVRLTPLIRGVPGLLETEAGGLTTITEESSTLLEQVADVRVTNAINDGFTGEAKILMDNPAAAGLAPFAQALRIAILRDSETVPEVLVWGPCNVVEDYAEGTLTLQAQDQSLRMMHHYIRRGDAVLNLPDDRGELRLHPGHYGEGNLDLIVDAARNTIEQQNRGVPALALPTFVYGNQFGDEDGAPLTQFERGQECWDLIQQFARGIGGPDLIMEPEWYWDVPNYGWLTAYDAPTDPTSPGSTELGRNLDPIDPDDPTAGEVVFDYGLGADNLEALQVSPARPTTHAHVLDRDKEYRATSADADSSADVGVYVDWVETDQVVPRPRTGEDPDLRVLQALADMRVAAYGRPVNHITVTLRPDAALTRHYGHPFWPLGTPGDFYLGDRVRVRGLRWNRSFSTLARITSATLKQDGWNGLVRTELQLVPAVAGTPTGEDF